MKENHNRILLIIQVCHSPNEIQEVHVEHLMLNTRNWKTWWISNENIIHIYNWILYITYLYNLERFEKKCCSDWFIFKDSCRLWQCSILCIDDLGKIRQCETILEYKIIVSSLGVQTLVWSLLLLCVVLRVDIVYFLSCSVLGVKLLKIFKFYITDWWNLVFLFCNCLEMIGKLCM